MSFLSEDLRVVRDVVRDSRRTRQRKAAERDQRAEEQHRSWKNWFGNPARIAMDALSDHEQRFDGTICSCRHVREGASYREHLVDVLNNASLLKVPPHVSGEGW